MGSPLRSKKPFSECLYRLVVQLAAVAHEALDLGDVVGPARGGEGHARGGGHVIAGL